jgi:NDP-sugar pyrophosphorylase family protein
MEKPVYSFAVSMGINVLKKRAVCEFLKPGQYLDIPDLMLQLSSGGDVYCYNESCRWLDIGRVEDYQQATAVFESCPEEFLPNNP